MKKINLDDSTKDWLWYLIYPTITSIWLICLTCSHIDKVREPDIYENNYTVEASSVIIKTPVQITHDTIYIDKSGSIIKEIK